MYFKDEPDLDKPWHLATRTDAHGNVIVPAFNAAPPCATDDAQFIYWSVNLHDYLLANDEKQVIQIFHKREDAERFIADHEGKTQ